MVKKYYKKIDSTDIDVLLGELDSIESGLHSITSTDEIRIYNNKEINDVLGINEKLLRYYRFDGKLGYTKVGDKYWYTQNDIDEFMAKHYRKPFA